MGLRRRNLTVLRSVFNPYADGTFMLARDDNAPRGERYKIAWESRHNPVIDEFHTFSSRAKALRDYNTMLRRGDLPISATLTQDWQQQAYYDWEHEHVDPHDSPIDEHAARRLLRQIARDYGVKTPRLVWLPENYHAEYDCDTNTIECGYHNKVTILHEMAHALVDFQIDCELIPHHGPAFVWQAMMLFHEYGGYDLDKMKASARKAGLLGPVGKYEIHLLPRVA